MRFQDRVGSFWVVTVPRMSSTASDICFETTVLGFGLQIKGGLNMDEVAGVFQSENEAKALAGQLLAGFDAEPECESHRIKGPNGLPIWVTIPGCDCSTDESRRGFLQVQTGRS